MWIVYVSLAYVVGVIATAGVCGYLEGRNSHKSHFHQRHFATI